MPYGVLDRRLVRFAAMGGRLRALHILTRVAVASQGTSDKSVMCETCGLRVRVRERARARGE